MLSALSLRMMAALSSSWTFTASSVSTSWYSPAPLAEWVSFSVSSVASRSPPAATVTVWAVSQLDVVKVSSVWSRVRSVSAWPDMVTVTSAVGLTASFTV